MDIAGWREDIGKGASKFPQFHRLAQTQFRTAPERTPYCADHWHETCQCCFVFSLRRSFFLLEFIIAYYIILTVNMQGRIPYTGFTLLPFPNPRAMFFSPMPKRILIVEDEISVRNAVRIFLEHHSPFEVCGEAANGVEAVDKAVALQPDLVILDLSMPHMNGIEAASLLRSRLPLVPIVVYTMFGDVLGKSLASALGVAAIVSKSDGLAILLARIQALLASTTLVQPPVAK